MALVAGLEAYDWRLEPDFFHYFNGALIHCVAMCAPCGAWGVVTWGGGKGVIKHAWPATGFQRPLSGVPQAVASQRRRRIARHVN